MAARYHRSAFIKALRGELPDIDPWLKDYRDNITLEMMRVLHYAQNAITKKDLGRVKRLFQFLERAFLEGSPDVRNSIVVTFLEHIEFPQATDLWAQALLPSTLSDTRNKALKQLRALERPR